VLPETPYILSDWNRITLRLTAVIDRLGNERALAKKQYQTALAV
jgi:hypothetical protein